MTTTSQKIKELGLKSLAQVAELTKQSPQTLDNWNKNKPELFEIVLLGCLKMVENMNKREVTVEYTVSFDDKDSATGSVLLKNLYEYDDMSIIGEFHKFIRKELVEKYGYGYCKIENVDHEYERYNKSERINKIYEFGVHPKNIEISNEASYATSAWKAIALVSEFPKDNPETKFLTSERAVKQLLEHSDKDLRTVVINGKITVITKTEMEYNKLKEVTLKHIGETSLGNHHWEIEVI